MILPLPNSKIKNANTSKFDVQLDVCTFEFCLPVTLTFTDWFIYFQQIRHCVETINNLRINVHRCSSVGTEIDYEQSSIFPQGQQSERNASARENHPTREVAFSCVGDFHARSRFSRSTIPEEKWGTTRRLYSQSSTGNKNLPSACYAG